MKHPFDRFTKAVAGGGPGREALRPRLSPPPPPCGEREGAFDRLARWPRRCSRREALRRLGGGLAATLLVRMGVRWLRAKEWITSPDPASARKKGDVIA